MGKDRTNIHLGKVFILGDSYSTYENYIPDGYAIYYQDADVGQTGVNRVELTWWKQLLRETASELALNCSYSGSTLCHTGYDGADCVNTSFAGRLDRYIEDGFFQTHPVDTFIVFGGTNDSWAGSPVGELKYSDWTKQDIYSVLPAFCYLLHRAKTNIPSARIICVINTDLRPEIAAGLCEAGRHYGAETVVLQNISKISGHPSIEGMKQIKDQILAVLQPSD